MYKILIPLDGSKLAEKALEAAGELVGPGNTFVLLQVLNPVFGVLIEEEKLRARGYLEEMSIRLRRKCDPSDVQLLVLRGSVANTILEAAEEQDVDLIALTPRGSGGVMRWVVGSVAQKVVRHAPCPVLTVGGKTDKRRIG